MKEIIAEHVAVRHERDTAIEGQVWAVTKCYSPDEGDFTAVGVWRKDSLVGGIPLHLLGAWEETPYGKQFKVQTYHVRQPKGRDGIEAFVRQCRGIGKTTAGRLVDKFGEDTIDMLIDRPDEVKGQIPRLSDEMIDSASATLRARRAGAEYKLPLISLLHRLSFPHSIVDQILDSGVPSPVEKIRENPFWLSQFPGGSFSRCDALRKRLNGSPQTTNRFEAAVRECFRNRSSETWLNKWTVLGETAGLLGFDIRTTQQRLSALVNNKKLTYRYEYLAIPDDARRERDVAELVMRHTTAEPDLLWPELTTQDGVSAHQIEQTSVAFRNGNVAWLTGSAGSGKSFLTAVIMKKFRGKKIVAAAPTGKAANRLKQLSLQNGITSVQPTTIHRMLGATLSKDGWRFRKDGKNSHIEADLVVIDEVSMLTHNLAYHLFKAIRPGTLILLVGDPYQLPPVGQGTLLRDWPEWCNQVPRFTYGLLSEIHRNAGKIVQVSHAISRAVLAPIENDDGNLGIVPAQDDEAIQKSILRVIKEHLNAHDGKDWTDYIQVVVSNNAQSPASKDELNPLLRRLFNPNARGYHKHYKIGDKVICLENSLFKPLDRSGKQQDKVAPVFVANGDFGRVTQSWDNKIAVRWDSRPDDVDEVLVPTGGGKGPLDHGYAVTAHKMQGSQAHTVFVVASDTYAARTIMDRNWLYTALTRAEKNCIVFGTNETLAKATKRSYIWNRKSFLLDQFTEAYSRCVEKGAV